MSICNNNELVRSYKTLSNENKKCDVIIDFNFIKIGEIDMMNDKYQAEVYIEAYWIANENIEKYDPAVHWNPLLYIENLVTESMHTIEYKMSYNENNQLIITEHRKIKGKRY